LFGSYALKPRLTASDAPAAGASDGGRCVLHATSCNRHRRDAAYGWRLGSVLVEEWTSLHPKNPVQ